MTDESREVDIELALDEGKLARGFELILEGLGIDWTADPHFRETPERAAKAWYHELFSGLTGEVPTITTFPDRDESQLVILQGIPVKSVCAHHLLPFFGTASVGYISGTKRLLGLSKLSRIVDYCARRPHVQEGLTNNIADYLMPLVCPPKSSGGCGVVIKATHLCMAMRGVKHDGLMVTSALRGSIKDEPETRAEFLKLADV